MFLSSSYKNFIRANTSISAPSLSKYPLVFLSGPYTADVITQSYCAIFHFARGLRREDVLCVTDATCVAFALALCLKKKKKTFAAGPKKGADKNTTHKNLMTD